MPEIGATLREARMRARIDISEIESETKIRAKYLRALENEEWDLLPGPTYVKSFLRTYADALGLDSKLLLEEYKLRHERLSEVELQPITPTAARRRRGPEPRPLPRGWAIGLVVGALLVALYLLGRSAGDDGGEQPSTIAEPPARTTPSGTGGATANGDSGRRRQGSGTSARRRSRVVRLQIVPTGQVYVCLEAAGTRRLVDGVILGAGQSRTYRSRSFRLTLGNSNVRLRINGRTRSVPEVSDGIGYRITREGRTVLPPDRRPSCT
jgi:cytoskeleton protein RodZ